ncbi:MAG: D-alanyl-D-alanine carboxypeptidase [Hyphomicrobiales bacterium]|nr:D-alanyl-D-alanine carboxypeptidase [Hyphomicrobiales bacterium]
MLLVFAVSQAAAGPSLVFDARTGDVLLAHKAGDAWHPASLTKMMTVYAAFRAVRAGKISLKQKITMTKEAAKQPPSKLGAKAGSKFTVDFAIRALMVRSTNDVAVALGQAVAGSESNFVAQMNAHAKRLGMTATHFVNPHGLHHPAQVTTARDMGILTATLVHEFPKYRSYFAQPYLKIGKKKLRNRNRLIGNMKGADGMKTGFVCASGFNLVASATRNGRQLVAVVLGHKAAGPRTSFAELLLEAAFAGKRRYVGGSGRISSIKNKTGAPADMRSQVCTRRSVNLAKPDELAGWGVTFGKFKGSLTAEAMLDGQILLTRSLIDGGSAGVVRLSGNYIPTIWSMRQQTALKLCSHLKARDSHCEVVPPATFTEIARLSKKQAAERAARAARKAKKKKRRKTKKKRKKSTKRKKTERQ